MSVTGIVELAGRETGTGGAGWRQCQVHVSGPGDPLLMLEVAERCPNRAEALLWFTCQGGHESTEEVCRGHVNPPESQWCADCVRAGNPGVAVITLIGWL
jgi:hypothetical protein